MSQMDSDFWSRARRAQDKLAEQFLSHPDVSLIDIGYAIEGGQIKSKEVVLRIHVREHWRKARPEERVAFPTQVDGIPVVVMPGDYSDETGVSGDRG